METDSSTTARVEPAETLIKVGLMLGAAVAGAKAPHTNAVRPAHNSAIGRLHEAKARFLIWVYSLCRKRSGGIDMRLAK